MRLLIQSSVNLIFLFLLCVNAFATETIETENENADWFVKRFSRDLISLTRDGKVVHFTFKNPGFSLVVDREYRSDFTLEEGQPFNSGPDDHSFTKYLLKAVGADGVTIQYESEFDHRSFGPDKITIDRGTFKLLFTGQPD